MTERQTEALERLNRGIQESRQEVQKRTMNLAQEYFGDSAEALKQQIKESRATLEGLPDQVPGGREEAFQAMYQELMDNYSSIEDCLDEAQQNVSGLDTDKLRRQGEIDATDAARREARERGVDLTKIEGTGTDGRIIYSDVVEAAEAMEEEGSGALGDGAAGQAAGQAQQAAGQVAGQAQDAAGGAAQQAQDVAGQATDQVGQVAGQAQEAVGGVTGGQQGGGGPLGGVTDQVGQAAGQAQDTAGKAAGQAQEAAGQATDQAGQVAGQAQEAAGGAAQQAQDTAGQAAQQGQQAAGQAQETAGQAAGQVTGGDGADGPKATNAARRKAQELGVDLSQVQGTGSGGLITIKDVVGS